MRKLALRWNAPVIQENAEWIISTRLLSLFFGGFIMGGGSLIICTYVQGCCFFFKFSECSVILFNLCWSKVVGDHVTAPVSQPDPRDATGGNCSKDRSLVKCKLHPNILLLTWPGIPIFCVLYLYFFGHYYRTTNELVTVLMKTSRRDFVVLKQ